MELDLDNDKFRQAFDLVQNTNETFFFTGRAGTGKSTFLKYFVKSINKNFVIVAPTGIAALNAGGVTIHSFFQLPPRPFLPKDIGIPRFKDGSNKRRVIQAMDTLIIDEISMVRIDLLSAIDYSLRINSGDYSKPFGGKQVIFVGDAFQLPPVMPRDPLEHTIIDEVYGSPFFFKGTLFGKTCLKVIELKKMYRQSDLKFINILDRIRTDSFNQSDLQVINGRLISAKETKKEAFAVTLTTRKDMAENVNQSKLRSLKTKSVIHTAEITGTFKPEDYPTDLSLELKVGAQVMFVQNDCYKRWVNGTIGQVMKLNKSSIKVRLKDETICHVSKSRWEKVKYRFNRETQRIDQEVIGTFEQYPLKLAWAATIHKSQSQTFEKVIIDLGDGTFSSGQAYVALSRVTSLSGLFLKKELKPSDIFIDYEIKEFAESYSPITST